MFIVFKNKGILIIVYLMVSFIGTFILMGALQRNFEGIFSKVDAYISGGIALVIAAIWTSLTSEDHYRDKDGNKKKLDIVNELFFIKMKYWTYILLALSLILFGNSVFHYFH